MEVKKIVDVEYQPLTPELINERVHYGVVHWDFIEFAEMPTYHNVVTHPDTQIQLRVVDGSNNSAVGDVIVQKVFVHEAIKYDLDEFLRMKAQALPNGMPPQAVRWVDGIVFAFNGMARHFKNDSKFFPPTWN